MCKHFKGKCTECPFDDCIFDTPKKKRPRKYQPIDKAEFAPEKPPQRGFDYKSMIVPAKGWYA